MNPIFELAGEFFFWDETWANAYGPYETVEEAIERFEEYCKQLG